VTRFIEGKDRRQTLLLPESLDEYVATDNPVRVIDAIIDTLDLPALGFAGARPAATGRPSADFLDLHHIATTLLRKLQWGRPPSHRPAKLGRVKGPPLRTARAWPPGLAWRPAGGMSPSAH